MQLFTKMEELQLTFNAYLGYPTTYATAVAIFTVIAGVVVGRSFVYRHQRKLQIKPTEDDEDKMKTPGTNPSKVILNI